MDHSPNRTQISVVVPVYFSEGTLLALFDRIHKCLSRITFGFELILVDDGSQDRSWQLIQSLSKLSPHVKGIKLSRNFGQHYAISAGCRAAKGEWVVVMDADLQDRPEEIEVLYQKALEGFPVVLASRKDRKDDFGKILSSRLFFRLLSWLTGSKFDAQVGNFGIYHRRVIQEFNRMQEPVRIFSVMIHWMGFPTAKIPVQHEARSEGKSRYTFQKRLNLALEIVLAYSDKPIRLMVKAGILLSFLSVLFGGITLIRYFLGEITVSGYSSLIISIAFFSGVLIAMLGVVGLYIGKIFESVKNRPLYVIDQTTDSEKDMDQTIEYPSNSESVASKSL